MSVYGYTQNYRLRKIAFDSRGWQTDEWSNLDVIDGILASAGTPIPFVVAGGTADVVTLTYSPVVAAYVLGLQLSFIASGTNTGAMTINANGLGAKALKGAGGSAMSVGQITTGMYVKAIYNGTDFTVIQPSYTNTQTPHITTAASGASPDSTADDFYIENDNDVGSSWLSPAGYSVRLYFGRPLVPAAGGLRYDHSTDTLYIRNNAVENVSFDSSGRMRQLNVPAFTASKSTTGSFPATTTDMLFNTELLDNNSNYDPATGKFTAPIAGVYHFDTSLVGSIGSGADVRVFGRFFKNGSAVGDEFSFVFASGPAATTSRGFAMALAAGDYVTVRYNYTIGASTIGAWNAVFSGHLVG